MDTYNGVNSLISNEVNFYQTLYSYVRTLLSGKRDACCSCAQEYSLEISPQVDELKCAKTKADPGEPGLFSVSVRILPAPLPFAVLANLSILFTFVCQSHCCFLQILPDVSGWKYVGTDAFRDIQANVWKYAKR